ncbi:MAG: hypothetical protein WCC36_00890, partial [Gammaproteobacteria bacterium]
MNQPLPDAAEQVIAALDAVLRDAGSSPVQRTVLQDLLRVLINGCWEGRASGGIWLTATEGGVLALEAVHAGDTDLPAGPVRLSASRSPEAATAKLMTVNDAVRGKGRSDGGESVRGGAAVSVELEGRRAGLLLVVPCDPFPPSMVQMRCARAAAGRVRDLLAGDGG